MLNRTGIGVGDYSEFLSGWFQSDWSKSTVPRRKSVAEFFVPLEFSSPPAIDPPLFVPLKNPSTRNRRRNSHQESQEPAAHKACLRTCILRHSNRSESCELTLRIWQVPNAGFVTSSIHYYRRNADFSRSSNDA